MAKSLYSKVSLELLKAYKYSQYLSKYNNLVKLRSDASDLGDYTIVSYIDGMLPYVNKISSYGSSKLYEHCRRLRGELEPLEQSALSYCNSMLALQEPDWMILARRNGWAPK